MSASLTPTHPSIYLLGDHLDAALALGEDLLGETVVLADAVQPLTMARLVRQNRELAEFLSSARTLELSLIARILQAPRHAPPIRPPTPPPNALIHLSAAGPAPLSDAAPARADTTAHDFQPGDAAFAFLRSRALIARDAPSLARLSELRVGEDYLVAGRTRLGTLLDLVATFLDSLDLIYDLYGEPPEPEAMSPGAPNAGTAETSRVT